MLEVAGPVETSNCNSTVLIEQDYRARPPSQNQIQIFAHAQKELAIRLQQYFAIAREGQDTVENASTLDNLIENSRKLSFERSSKVELRAFSSKSTLRGQLQRWRENLAREHDEGVQFILEDNLLNNLLVASEAQPTPQHLNSLWIIKTCQAFYEKALSAPYMPIYLQMAINDLTSLCQKYHKPNKALISRQSAKSESGMSSVTTSPSKQMNASSQSFIPTQISSASNGQLAVKEMSPHRISKHDS